MIFKSGCHNKQLTFGRLISLCKNINRAGGLSIRQPATFFTVRVQTGSDWGYFWGYLRKLNEYNSLKINWMFSDVMFLLSHHFNFPKRPYSSITTLIYNDFTALQSISAHNFQVNHILNVFRIVYMSLFSPGFLYTRLTMICRFTALSPKINPIRLGMGKACHCL